jgi:anti-anti-sigma factor
VADTDHPADDEAAPIGVPAAKPGRLLGAAVPLTDPGSVHVIVGAVRTRIVLAGEIDADLAADLHQAAADAESAGLPIEVDTQHVTFMDSSGVAFLARLSTRSAEPVRLIRVPPTVRFLLDVTRIGELLDVVDEAPDFDLPPN